MRTLMTPTHRRYISSQTKKAMHRPDIYLKLTKKKSTTENMKAKHWSKGPHANEVKRRIAYMASIQKRTPWSEEVRQKMSLTMKGNTSAKGIPKSAEWKRKASERMKKNNPMSNKDVAFRALSTKMKNGWRPSIAFKDTQIELKTEAELKRRGITYLKQQWICNCLVDFYLPEYRVVIECDGDYWHTLPGCKERDEEKTLRLEFNGFNVYRFWEHDIHKSIEACIDLIIQLK